MTGWPPKDRSPLSITHVASRINTTLLQLNCSQAAIGGKKVASPVANAGEAQGGLAISSQKGLHNVQLYNKQEAQPPSYAVVPFMAALRYATIAFLLGTMTGGTLILMVAK